jgi:hypothetical protein
MRTNGEHWIPPGMPAAPPRINYARAYAARVTSQAEALAPASRTVGGPESRAQ